MKIPAFSRQTGATTTANTDEPTLEDLRTGAAPKQPAAEQRTVLREPTVAPPTAARVTTVTPQTISPQTAATIDRAAAERAEAAARAERAGTEPADRAGTRPGTPPVAAGPRPRASLLATLALITGVVSALLVLSGPLAGYGIGLAVLALILAVGGISATRRRHVAGKTDALIGLFLALGAVVVGVLALTGSLSWLGTDMEPVTRVREWLDAQFIERF